MAISGRAAATGTGTGTDGNPHMGANPHMDTDTDTDTDTDHRCHTTPTGWEDSRHDTKGLQGGWHTEDSRVSGPAAKRTQGSQGQLQRGLKGHRASCKEDSRDTGPAAKTTQGLHTKTHQSCENGFVSLISSSSPSASWPPSS